jgi:hypothetical protein
MQKRRFSEIENKSDSSTNNINISLIESKRNELRKVMDKMTFTAIKMHQQGKQHILEKQTISFGCLTNLI